MPQVCKLTAPPDGERVETGAIQFGEDWPGLFVRGDNALALAHAIRWIERCINLPSDQRTTLDLDHIDLALSSLRWIYRIIQQDVDQTGVLTPDA